jgi:predicted O-methyltransferase YrrM
MNYSAVAVLDALVDEGTSVFEYGSGASTAWLAARSSHVHAVEHDPEWVRRVRQLPGVERADVRHVRCRGDELDAPAGDAYVMAPATIRECSGFDVIIIDGWARRSCLAVAPRYLTAGGVLVLDDAERDSYEQARQRLVEDDGFVEVTVEGPKPAMPNITATSFFLPTVRR